MHGFGSYRTTLRKFPFSPIGSHAVGPQSVPRLVNSITSHSGSACVSRASPRVFARRDFALSRDARTNTRGPELHFDVFLCPSHRSHGVILSGVSDTATFRSAIADTREHVDRGRDESDERNSDFFRLASLYEGLAFHRWQTLKLALTITFLIIYLYSYW